MRYTKKRMVRTAAALCAIIGMTGALSPAINSWAAGYERVNGSYQMPDGTIINRAIARGIDVSRWQGNVNWQAVAADDVSFVMLGTRSKGVIDPYFHTNVQGAAAAGLKVGAYIYSLATTPDMAREEADFVLGLVKDYPISFPIAFDAEDSATLGSLPPAQVSEIINAFCERIAEAGYYPIVYANDHWLANKIDLNNMNYDVWVARYEVQHKYANPIMWQITSTGSIDGISGNVDIDFLYEDLSPKLPQSLWRTIGGQTYYYQNYALQKDAWINDGTGWFYMNSDGLASTGWLNQKGVRYYLDETSGKMATGWKQLDSKWYFFHESGSMNTGWLTDGGAQYYLNEDGIMASGWLLLDGKYYYLDETSGKMATGWKLLDNRWYFLQNSGIMASGWINPDGYWYYLGNDGAMKTAWLEEGGAKYYLSTSSGKMTVGWRQVDGAWYYFGPSGAMATGMIEVNGQQYYLNPSDGKMAANMVFDMNGISYSADANGVCTPISTQEAPAEAEMAAPGQGTEANSGTGNESGNSTSGEIGPGIKK